MGLTFLSKCAIMEVGWRKVLDEILTLYGNYCIIWIDGGRLEGER